MAIIRIPIRTEAEANQFISIVHSHGLTLSNRDVIYNNGLSIASVGTDACIWTGLKQYLGTRYEFHYPDETVLVNQLYKRLQEL